jgi:hypothetical protein
MRILYLNRLGTSGTLSATNEDANYPIEEVLDNTLTTLFKSTTTTAVITQAFAADFEISALAWGNTNATQIDIVMKNSGASTVFSQTLTGSEIKYSGSFPGNIFYPSSAVADVRTIILTCTGPDPLQFGGLYAGQYLQAPYFDVGPTLGSVSSASVQKSRYGVAYSVPGVSVDTFSADFSAVLIDDYDNINAFFRATQTDTPIWLDRWEDSTLFPPMFALVTNNIEWTKSREGIMFDNLTLDFEEIK